MVFTEVPWRILNNIKLVNKIFVIIIVILILDYLLDRLLDFLNSRRFNTKIPKQLEGIYDQDKYSKSQNYLKAGTRLSIFSSSVMFIAVLIVLYFGLLGYLDMYLRTLTSNPIFLGLFFFGIIALFSDLLGLPFALYATFVIEERFGFNKTKIATFFLDRIKSWLIGIVIGSLLISVIIWSYESLGNDFWWVVWIIITGFMIFMTMFYSNLIVPLFNKQKPLEEGALRDAIEDFASGVGFRLDNIFVIDGSKRSSKANAYFSGLGSKKRIVLYDTLINDHSTEELVAVLAHEIGHYKLKHTLLSIGLSVIQSGIMLYILSLFIEKGSELALAIANALGADVASFHVGLIGFGILYSPLEMVLGVIMNLLSRTNEYAADKYAADHYNGDHLITALKKISVNNLSNLNPHPLYVFFNYSHPTLLQRIEAIKK